MNNQVKGLLYYYSRDIVRTSRIFWTILVFILIATSVLAYFLIDVGASEFYWMIPFATYPNVCIIAFQSVKKDIPIGLKLGAIRSNIFLSYFYFFVGYSLFMSVLGNTLQVISEWLHQVLGVSNFIFTHPAMLVTDNWFTRTVIDFFFMFFLMALLFVIGLIFYRSGLIGGGIFLAVLLLVTLYGLFEGWLIDAFANLITDTSIYTFLILFLIGIVLYLFSYVFIKRITVVQKV